MSTYDHPTDKALHDAITPKTCHSAKHIASDGSGRVSALCFNPPRAINLKKETWTIRDDAVTCPKCLALLAERARGKDGGK